MAFVNIWGAETGDLTEFPTTSGTLSASQAQAHSPGTWSVRTNPTAGNARFDLQGLGTNGRPATFNIPTGFLTLYYYSASLPSAATELIYVYRDAGITKPAAAIIINTDGTLQAYYWNGSDTLTALALSAAVKTGQWNEIRIGIMNSATANGATVETWLNGIKFGSIAGISLTAAPANFSLCLVGPVFSVTTVDGYYDDISLATDDYKPGACQNLVPNATGSSSQWTNGAGTSPTNIAEVPNDGDTSYIVSSLAANVTTVNIGDINGTYPRAAIGTIKTVAYLRDLTNTDTVTLRDLSAGTGSDITTATLTTAYLPYAKLNDTDPHTSAGWTPAAVDALEIGVVDVSAITARCTALYAIVWANWTAGLPDEGESDTSVFDPAPILGVTLSGEAGAADAAQRGEEWAPPSGATPVLLRPDEDESEVGTILFDPAPALMQAASSEAVAESLRDEEWIPISGAPPVLLRADEDEGEQQAHFNPLPQLIAQVLSEAVTESLRDEEWIPISGATLVLLRPDEDTGEYELLFDPRPAMELILSGWIVVEMGRQAGEEWGPPSGARQLLGLAPAPMGRALSLPATPGRGITLVPLPGRGTSPPSLPGRARPQRPGEL